MGGCGSHCRCTDESSNEKEGVCATREGGVALDENGKCPCGKTKEDCCLSVQSQTQAGHKEKLPVAENEIVYELCKKHGKRHLCE